MFEELKKLLENANASYSNFKVSSIIIDKQNNKYNGVNLEFAIPTNSICAERNAITSAITDGMKMGDLREVHILAKGLKMDLNKFTPPCGVCRQLILETSNSQAKVFLYNLNGDRKEFTISELLPEAFSGAEI